MLRILLVDDHAVLRRGVEALITRASLGTVCGEAADGEEAIGLAKELKPDLIIMDISMPKLSGLDATRRIREFDRRVKIVILTMHDSSQLGPTLKEVGANGVVEKTAAEEKLAKMIKDLTAGPN